MKTWTIIDTNFLIWREFFAAGNREPVPSVIGALACGAEIVSHYAAIGVVWCFDVAPYNRSALFPEYKASRIAKTPDTDAKSKEELRLLTGRLHTSILKGAGVKNIVALSGFEADDHIAAAVKALSKKDEAVIVSRDADLFQLLSPRVRMYDPVGRAEYTRDSFREPWNIHPSEWPQVKAIAGCSTDDVPGVDGVAEVTAAKYLKSEMNRMSPTFAKIRNFIDTPDYARNVTLCSLPFPGTPPGQLSPDSVPTTQTWAKVCQLLGVPDAVLAFNGPRAGRRVACG